MFCLERKGDTNNKINYNYFSSRPGGNGWNNRKEKKRERERDYHCSVRLYISWYPDKARYQVLERGNRCKGERRRRSICQRRTRSRSEGRTPRPTGSLSWTSRPKWYRQSCPASRIFWTLSPSSASPSKPPLWCWLERTVEENVNICKYTSL